MSASLSLRAAGPSGVRAFVGDAAVKHLRLTAGKLDQPVVRSQSSRNISLGVCATLTIFARFQRFQQGVRELRLQPEALLSLSLPVSVVIT